MPRAVPSKARGPVRCPSSALLTGLRHYSRMVSVPSFRIATDSLQASTFESFLGVREALLGGQPVPAYRLGVIAGHTPALFVHDPEIVLGRGAWPCSAASRYQRTASV